MHQYLEPVLLQGVDEPNPQLGGVAGSSRTALSNDHTRSAGRCSPNWATITLAREQPTDFNGAERIPTAAADPQTFPFPVVSDLCGPF